MALAESAIPQELPAIVTITLAIGVHRMARRNAIIRKLPEVEALGSATVICSDKTGTLTQNRMAVQELYATGQRLQLEELWRDSSHAGLPSGFFRDALRTVAEMLAASHWHELPSSLQAVLSDVDGRGTDLGVFLERADLLVLRDGAALVGVSPPRLVLLERRGVLNWQVPNPQSLPDRMSYRLLNFKVYDAATALANPSADLTSEAIGAQVPLHP